MFTEQFAVAVCGPPLASNTSVSKDAGIYTYQLSPQLQALSVLKRSSAPVNAMAVSPTHIFTAQNNKAHVHVYSRERGNQEALVAFSERITAVALVGDVLVLGTAEGRVILWETCTGRQVNTPPCHVQAITCIETAPFHILTGSGDANVHVWSTARMLELDSTAEQEPDRVLSNHRGSITGLSAGASANPETSLCVSSSQDKTIIIWNYATGDALRTLLFASTPLCVSLDPSARAIFTTTDAGELFMVDMFGPRPLVGPHSEEHASAAVNIAQPLGNSDEELGPAHTMAVNYDGTTLITGHTRGKVMQWSLTDNSYPTELADLNAAVTNLAFMPILDAQPVHIKAVNIVKPTQAERLYTFTAQITTSLAPTSRFESMLTETGFSADALQSAVLAMQEEKIETSAEEALRKENEELWELVRTQK
ncbi:Pre-rRNA-processing protein ipi3 [Ceratocystis pirilliformis]|uniref:Pre-rRNA-processing protein IPI3 n=1 Tax=Ceratocystis pirilliformis TaxID=259994 RepID=A0ABR3Z2W9_9PEZI